MSSPRLLCADPHTFSVAARARWPGIFATSLMNGVPGRAADGAQWARRLAALSWLFPLVSLLAIWVLWYPPSPDLAAQVYRIHLFTVNGFSLWDNSWYDGHYVPGYSLIFPPLATLLGLRTVGVLAVSLSTLFFWRIARERRCFNEVPATLLFALGAAGDLYIGRVTFALGVTFALASALAATRGRRGWCAACSLACAAASPGSPDCSRISLTGSGATSNPSASTAGAP